MMNLANIQAYSYLNVAPVAEVAPVAVATVAPVAAVAAPGKMPANFKFADVSDNLWSVGGSFKGNEFNYASKLADNSTVCDSRGNCIVGDELFINFSKVGKVNIRGDVTVHEGKNGSPAANMIKVDKVGIFDVNGGMTIKGYGSKLADVTDNLSLGGCNSGGGCGYNR